jgi:hypothetical protein
MKYFPHLIFISAIVLGQGCSPQTAMRETGTIEPSKLDSLFRSINRRDKAISEYCSHQLTEFPFDEFHLRDAVITLATGELTSMDEAMRISMNYTRNQFKKSIQETRIKSISCDSGTCDVLVSFNVYNLNVSPDGNSVEQFSTYNMNEEQVWRESGTAWKLLSAKLLHPSVVFSIPPVEAQSQGEQ